MWLKSLSIDGFRSFQHFSMEFEPGLTTIVGENNTGKSSVGLATERLFAQAARGNSSTIDAADHPYGVVGPMAIEATISLRPDELLPALGSHMLPEDVPKATSRVWEDWLVSHGQEIVLTLRRPSERLEPEGRWGDLYFLRDTVCSGSRIQGRGAGQRLSASLLEAEAKQYTAVRINGQLKTPHTADHDLTNAFGKFLMTRWKRIPEFRLRSQAGQLRTPGVTESLAGSETADALLTLKNHHDPLQKARYRSIVAAFRTLYRHFSIDAVETGEGSNIPTVQFYEAGRPQPLALEQLSAGVHERLALMTNLISREGLVIFLEHPELHLHPHAIRWLKSFLIQASAANQIIVVTHDPRFVRPEGLSGIRRVWWLPGQGTDARHLNPPAGAKRLDKVKTMLRHLHNREVFFARAVLLVEDESLYEFISTVAPELGFDLDAAGVSVAYTNGHGGHRPFHWILDDLGIPHVNLRDKTWGHNPKFPHDRFFSLGKEFEEFMDAQGYGEIRAQANRDAGESHRRPAALLGEKLKREQVPAIFAKVLNAVVSLATGQPLPEMTVPD